MASKSLGTLTLSLTAEIGGFVKGMDKAERQSDKWRKQVEKDLKVAATAIAGLSAAAAAGLSALVMSSAKSADESRKLAQSIGLTTEAFTGLTFAASQNGVAQGELRAGITAMNRSLLEAAAGSEKQTRLFSALGVSATDAAGDIRSGDEVLKDLADRFASMPDGAQKSALAMKVFGDAGSKMIPMLNSGAQGIEALTAQAEKLGLVISDKTARQAELFNDNLSLMAAVGQGAANQLMERLMPAMSGLTTELSNVSADGAVSAVVLDQVANALLAIGQGAVATIGGLHIVGSSLKGLRDLNEASKGGGAWWEQWLPPVRIYRAYQSMDEIRGSAADTGDQLSNLALMYAGFIDQLNSTGAGEGGANSAETRLANLRKIMEGYRVERDTDATRAQKQLESAFESAASSYHRQIALFGEANESQNLLYDIQHGKLVGINDEQQKRLIGMAQELDILNDRKRALAEQEEIESQVDDILASLLSDEDKIKASYDRRREFILASEQMLAEEKTAVLMQLEEKRNEELLAINGTYWEKWLAAAEKNLESFDELAGFTIENFSGRVGNAFEAMVFDAETLDGAIQGMAEGMARSVVNALGEMAAQWIAYQAVQLLVGKTTQGGAAASMASTASAQSVMAGLNAFTSTAAIPLVGPALAPAAAAAATAATAPMAATVSAMALSGVQSFEGGGYTGAGPRSGGLDGKGGFMAMVHPDETIIDHAKGQGMGVVVNIHNAPEGTSVRESRSAEGKQMIDVLIGDLMSDGRAAKTLERAYGLSRKGY